MTQYVIYSRKSQEDDDKQVQSIPSQESEMTTVATRCCLTVAERLSESKSAKAPGRPVFNEMMERVDRGEIRGILCWKLDRLARNPVDGGRIIWAIKQHGLVIRTPHQTFSQAEDNIILMYIEFGMAQKYVDDLSANTTRGLEDKAKSGWLPSVAPIGYLNSKVEERGKKTIFPDPKRFDAVRRMWDMMLSGKYSPARIQKIANDEWGFRTRQTRKTGGKPICRAAIYKIFSNSFYFGRFEYPVGSGVWHDGAHKPMIRESEFKAVQKLLHRETNPRPQIEFDLPFRGLIKCGECGSSITAHFKEQVRCPSCRYKSSVKNRNSCARCGLSLSEMRGKKIRRYGYYHCTRTLNPGCRQKCISATVLEKQVVAKIRPYGLPPEIRDWGIQYIKKLEIQEYSEKSQILEEKKARLAQCVTRLGNLVRLKTAPENADNSLISDEEYQMQRTELIAEKNRLLSETTAFEDGVAAKTHLAQNALQLLGNIEITPIEGNTSRQREILAALGLNHALKEKELEIRPEFPFTYLNGDGIAMPSELHPIEPDKTQAPQGSNGYSWPLKSNSEPGVDEDRTMALKDALNRIWKKLS